MSNRVELELAYVLHSRPYRDTSLLVELLTKEYGRVVAIARSARGPKSRFRGVLRLLLPLKISWTGKGDLVSLQQAEQLKQSYQLPTRALFSSLYMNELLVRLLARWDPFPELFDYYQHSLEALEQHDDCEIILRKFEKHLLEQLGYKLQLEVDPHSEEKVQADKYYLFDPQLGPCEVEYNSKTQDNIVSGKTLLSLQAEELKDKQSLREAKHIMRLALQPLLGDKPIRSRELFIVPIVE